jgi:branched-chain amino acid transport system substrate-binding protein
VGSVVLVADEMVAARREVVYGLFGARAGAGWVFAAECDTLAVGSVVTLQLPVGIAVRQARPDDPGQVVAALQRLRAIVPRGSVELTDPHHIRQQLRLAEASVGGFRLLDSAS